MAGSEGVSLRLDDNKSGSVSAEELAYLTTQIFSYSTQWVDMYLYQRYVPSSLALSWLVNYWATLKACVQLSKRRGNPVPASWKKQLEDAVEDLERARAGEITVPPPALLRRAPSIQMANVWVDHRYWVAKCRVERVLSVGPAVDYARKIDRWVDYIVEY
jgi:hypothetical protein